MASLRERDYRSGLRLLGSVGEAACDLQSFARAGVRALPGLVASELTTLSVCDLSSGRRDVYGVPDGAIGSQERASFDRHFREHPLVHYHADLRGPGAHRISDSVPFARFRHSALYSDYYRRIGMDHALALPLRVDERLLVSFVLNRKGRDFSDRECELLDVLRVHLAQLHAKAWALDAARAAAAQLTLIQSRTDCVMLGVDARHRLRDATPQALRLLARFGVAPLQSGAPLPALLARWLASLPREHDASAGTLALSCGDDRLLVHAVPDPALWGGRVLLLEERLGLSSPERFAALPLTARERDVLRWLAAGKTDREIAAILAVSVRTVQKHLERMYPKLGVETRTAAVMRALGQSLH
jgi:DNA-binding CsgD family transcriptional regulator